MSAGGGRIASAFAKAREEGRAVIIPYLTCGYPSPEETVGLVGEAASAGADLIELGLPFSDPLADGPVIQAASQQALEAGATLAGALEAVREVRKESAVPLLFMGYYNPLHRFGLSRFFQAMREAGGDGVIVPDLPLEESGDLRSATAAAGISFVPLVAPTTPEPRLKVLDAAASDFLYCVSLTGVTGARDELDVRLPEYLERVDRQVSRPFVVGFGISRPDQVDQVAPPAAGVVIGSALIRAIAAAGDAGARRRATREFVASFAAAARGAGRGERR